MSDEKMEKGVKVIVDYTNFPEKAKGVNKRRATIIDGPIEDTTHPEINGWYTVAVEYPEESPWKDIPEKMIRTDRVSPTQIVRL